MALTDGGAVTGEQMEEGGRGPGLGLGRARRGSGAGMHAPRVRASVMSGWAALVGWAGEQRSAYTSQSVGGCVGQGWKEVKGFSVSCDSINESQASSGGTKGCQKVEPSTRVNAEY